MFSLFATAVVTDCFTFADDGDDDDDDDFIGGAFILAFVLMLSAAADADDDVVFSAPLPFDDLRLLLPPFFVAFLLVAVLVFRILPILFFDDGSSD